MKLSPFFQDCPKFYDYRSTIHAKKFIFFVGVTRKYMNLQVNTCLNGPFMKRGILDLWPNFIQNGKYMHFFDPIMNVFGLKRRVNMGEARRQIARCLTQGSITRMGALSRIMLNHPFRGD
jgi:hypothetical protein